ncbi:DNA polymerase III subunit beta [Mollicutes bacterium LVI A0039]|nr:DNA polymerase III subunit beta [Mollicutes bacterium LVI A0039]
MEIIIKQRELLKALNIVEKAISSKTIIESLKGIKIIAKNNSLTFIASKTELAIEYVLEDVNVTEEGTIVVFGSQFINIVKKLTDDESEIKIHTENNLVILQTETSKVSLVTLNVYDYPEINFDSKDQSVIVPKKLLQKAYSKTKYSIATNTAKVLLTAINLRFTEEELRAASTDSKRLAFVTLDPVPGLDLEMNISKFLYQDIIRVLDLIAAQEVVLYKNTKQIQIECKNLKIKGRLIDGEYPMVENLIPSRSNYSFEIASATLLSALDKVQSLSDKSNSVVTIEHVDGKLLIKFFIQELGGIEEFVAIENIEGNPFKIAFDPVYVIDALHSIAKEQVKLSFEAETSAFQINGVASDDNIQVISPIRMS